MKMKNLNSTLGRTTTLLALGAMLSLPVSSPAVTLNINSSLSTLTLSGGAFGLTYTEQVPGSLSDSWGGTITANDLGGGQIAFTGGSSIIAVLNPVGPFSTAPAPYPTGGDNYGATESGFVGPPFDFSTVNGAYRSLTLDVTSGTATSGLVPTGVFLTFTGGHLDFGASTAAGDFPGSSAMTGKTGTDTSLGLVSWDGFTLSLPVRFLTTGDNALNELWVGTLVATVPEPSTLALGAIGLVGFLVASRNRSRARRI